jgi:membrane protease YdiL (CAAX protease family)
MTVLKAILLTILLIFTFILFQIGLSFIFYNTELLPESFKKHTAIINVIAQVSSYLIVFKLFWKPKSNITTNLNFKKIEMKFLPYLIFIVIGLQLLDRPFWNLVPDWNYIKDLGLETDKTLYNGFNPVYFYSALSTLIIAPILEEFFFRNFLLKKLLQKNSQKIGILISSICFAIIHIETPSNLVPTFIFGIISSLIFIKTKRIGHSIILHFLFNLLIEIFLLIEILSVFNLSINEWFLNLNFNFMYWILFLFGVGITYFATKKLLATPCIINC